MKNTNLAAHLERIEKKFQLSVYDLKAMSAAFHAEMDRGLRGEPSSLKMLPAFVDIASGREKGSYLALDLGGTNFRVLEVALSGDRHITIKNTEKFAIPRAVMCKTGVQLFNFIAWSIQKFMKKHAIACGKKIRLGFTFSFPIEQKTILSGTLINWTKGFSAKGVVGKDVVKLLEKALSGYGLGNIEIAALANDTVGTLAAKSYEESGCDVGVIFGTGTNACYRELTKNIKKLSGSAGRGMKNMIVNIEWGNYDKLLRNEYDEKLDRATNNTGRQIMEKMISGMYLGELARLVISDLIRKKALFPKGNIKFGKGVFNTAHMSHLQSDTSKDMQHIRGHLADMGIVDVGCEELLAIKKICKVVSTRAAKISAMALSSVITWMDPEISSRHSAAIDGTLYERYPGFRTTIKSVFGELHGPKGKRITLTRAKDGSGTGVAVVAAVAKPLR